MTQPTAVAEMVDTGSLRAWPQNPRKNDGAVARVADSIRKFGFAAPIVARLETREIIAGHTRWKAAKLLKMTQVPVRFVDLDERQAHLLALADNRLGELAEWDTPELHALLASYDAIELPVAGWSEDDLAAMAPDAPPTKRPKKEENHCPYCGRYMSDKLMAAHTKRETGDKHQSG